MKPIHKNDNDFDPVSLAESFTQGIIIIDLKTRRIEYGNSPFYAIVGTAHKNLLHDAAELFQFVRDDDRHVVDRSIQEILMGNPVNDMELKMSTTDKVISCSGSLLKGSSKAVVFVQDITRSKEHKDYIVGYSAKKDTLLEMLAHHISGPLSLSRQMLLHLEKKSGGDRAYDIAKEVSIIKEITAQCIDFITDFLKEEHLVSQNISVKHERFDVVKIANDIISQYNASYPDRTLTYSGLETLIIRNDDVKLMQILNNLISNAVKFTHIHGRISVDVQGVGNRVSIKVTDDGIGIPLSLQPHVFEKYTTAGREGLNGEKSVGLGLSIVKTLTHLMSGDITLMSNEGQGTTFRIDLPKN